MNISVEKIIYIYHHTMNPVTNVFINHLLFSCVDFSFTTEYTMQCFLVLGFILVSVLVLRPQIRFSFTSIPLQLLAVFWVDSFKF